MALPGLTLATVALILQLFYVSAILLPVTQMLPRPYDEKFHRSSLLHARICKAKHRGNRPNEILQVRLYYMSKLSISLKR